MISNIKYYEDGYYVVDLYGLQTRVEKDSILWHDCEIAKEEGLVTIIPIVTPYEPSLDDIKRSKLAELQQIITQQEQKALRPSQDLQAFGTDYPEYSDDMNALTELRTVIKANRALITNVNNAMTKEEVEDIEPIKVVI